MGRARKRLARGGVNRDTGSPSRDSKNAIALACSKDATSVLDACHIVTLAGDALGHPRNRVLLPACLHHPRPGLHRGRHLDRRLLQPPPHPHQPRRQIPHRIPTTPSGLDNSRINKPSTTCAQAQCEVYAVVVDKLQSPFVSYFSDYSLSEGNAS